MPRDLERIQSLADELTRGFDERVEYDLRFVDHAPACAENCPRSAMCACPSTTERRIKTMRRPPLIQQLQDVIAEQSTGPDTGGRSSTRVDSGALGNLDALDLIQEIKRELSSAVRRARQILGYDVPPSSVIRGIVCGECEGALRLQNGKAVCIGRIDETPPCGTEYTWQQIEDYLNANQSQ